MRPATILIALLMMPLAVSAGEATSDAVTIPVGDWIAQLSDLVGLLVLAGAVWLLRKLPAPIHQVLMTIRAEQLLARAVDYGVQSVAGAARGKTLTVDVGNRVLATASGYAVEAAGDVVAWLGGEEELQRKIVARLDLEPDAETAEDPDGRIVGLVHARRAA